MNYIQFNSEGKAVSAGTLGVPIWELPGYSSDTHKEYAEELPRLDSVYWDGEEVKEIPPSPGEQYKFNYVSLTWELDQDEAWLHVRIKRNQLIKATDYILLPDIQAALNQEQKDAWLLYRQELRDITEQPDPCNIIWPTKPTI